MQHSEHLPMSIVVSSVIVALSAATTTRTADSATRSIVTPTGVYQATQSGSASASPMKAAANPNPSTIALRWVHPDAVSVVNTVSAGNHGTFAWLGMNQNSQRMSLVATTDDAGG